MNVRWAIIKIISVLPARNAFKAVLNVKIILVVLTLLKLPANNLSFNITQLINYAFVMIIMSLIITNA